MKVTATATSCPFPIVMGEDRKEKVSESNHGGRDRRRKADERNNAKLCKRKYILGPIASDITSSASLPYQKVPVTVGKNLVPLPDTSVSSAGQPKIPRTPDGNSGYIEHTGTLGIIPYLLNVVLF